jgi:peptidoglycan/LPS O-acetylase OafA/YrhL
MPFDAVPKGLSAGRYRFGLDLLRAAAIGLVLIGHGLIFTPGAVASTGLDYVGLLFVFGGLGVELFFCLSGFLIGTILLDLHEAGLSGRELRVFLIRRWMRTLPLYLTVLVLLMAVPLFAPPPFAVAWPYFVMAQNLFSPMPGWFSQSWSLTIEEWSYIILPLLAFALRRRAGHPVVAAAVVLCLAGIALRFAVATQDTSWTLTAWDNLVRKMALSRLDAIGYGVLSAWAVRRGGEGLARWTKHLCLLGIAMIAANTVLIYHRDLLPGFYGRHLLFPWIAASFCLILPAAAAMRTPDQWLSRPVAFFARISYALYLCHLSIATLFQDHPPPGPLFLGYLLVSVVGAAMLSYGIEQPIMRRRPKQRKRPSDA